MSTIAQTQDQAVEVWDGQLTMHVKVAGQGDPILYLHPAAGLAWDPFLDELSKTHTVYAPEFPGTSQGDAFAIHKVDDLDDLILIYEETIRRLELTTKPIAIGQSFGGMLVLELAARYPDLFAKAVVLDPIGLWRDDLPVASYMELAPPDLGPLLFHDPTGPAATAMLTPPEDPEEAVAVGAGLVWALGCTGKFVWPVPDRGLTKRLHRIQIPTLIVWGEQDKLINAAYADEFRQRIDGSRIEIIAGSGHIPQVEQTEATLAVIQPFVDGAATT